MLRRFRPVLLAAAVAVATPPLAAQLPGRRPAEVAPAPHPVATLQMPASLAGGAEAALEILAGAAERVAEALPGVGFQTWESGMTLPSPMYLQHSPQYFPPDPAFPLPQELAAREVPQVRPASEWARQDAAPKPAARPVGTWVRDVGPAKIALAFTADRLTATVRVQSGETPAAVTKIVFDADYAVAKDGTLYGVIFAADSDNPMIAIEFQPLVGQPFACGWRADGDTLSLRNMKCLGAGLSADKTSDLADLPMAAGGRYTRMDPAKLPAWEKAPPASLGGLGVLHKHVEGRCDEGPRPSPLPSPVVRTIQTLPDGTTVERLGVDFSGPPPLPPAGAAPLAPRPGPVVYPNPVPFGPPSLPTATYLPPPPPLPGGGPAMYPPGVVGPLDPLPAPGPWTLPPSTPWQQAGPMFPGPRGYPQAVPVPTVCPPVVVPAAATAPVVSLPPPPPKRDKPAAGVSVAWHPRVVYLPDVTRRGVATPCLVGRLFLFDAAGAPLPAAGGVKVVATDDTPRDAAGPKSLPEERWSFDLDAMKRLLAPAPEHEPHYTLVLPWPGYRPDATRVRLAVQYAQPDGGTTWAPEVVLVHPANMVRPLPQAPTTDHTPPLPPEERYVKPQPTPASGSGVIRIEGRDHPLRPEISGNPVLGTWVREQDGVQLVLTLSEKRMRLALNAAIEFPGAGGPGRITQTLDADCGFGPDGTVFGVLTGADMTIGGGFPSEVRAGAGEARKMMGAMAGTLFRFRARVDGGRLTLADAVMTSPDGSSVSAKVPPELFGSGFERATEPVPPPRPGTGVGMFGVATQYSSDPNVRVQQLLGQSEEVRQVEGEWKRFWSNDMPSHLTPDRVPGGVGPKPAAIPASK